MARRTITDEQFAQFWALYPLRKGRIEAERTWSRLSKADRKAAIEGVQAYVDDCNARGCALKYPQGYLSGHRWEDEDSPINNNLAAFRHNDKSTSRQVDKSGRQNETMELW